MLLHYLFWSHLQDSCHAYQRDMQRSLRQSASISAIAVSYSLPHVKTRRRLKADVLLLLLLLLLLQIVEQENKLRASGKRQQQQSKCVTHPDAQAEAASQYDQLQPGRRCMLSLSQSEASTTAQTYLQDGKGQQQSARFTAAVLDVDAATARRAVRDCAVFIVPQVRFHVPHAACMSATCDLACATHCRANFADTAPKVVICCSC